MIQEYFTFDKMSKRISEYIKTCDKCQRCKDTDNRNLFGGTKPILPTQKGDFYGPLSTSTGGVKYLFVMVYNFTKFVKLYTLRRATTAATLRRIRQYCDEFGTPKAILTDNGTQFTSKHWVNGLNDLRIKPKYTPIRNPCANLAERINRQLGNLFRIFVGEQHTKWSQFIATIESCINETYHETIEITSYEAQLGRKPTRVWDRYINKEITGDCRTDSQQIFVKMKMKRENRANKMNENIKTTKFKVGDLVLIRTYCQSDTIQRKINKFCELYSGPYKVKQILGEATYTLVKWSDEQKFREKFNIRQLKRYYPKRNEN